MTKIENRFGRMVEVSSLQAKLMMAKGEGKIVSAPAKKVSTVKKASVRAKNGKK